MRKLLILISILCSLTTTAQWQLTGSRVRYVNGIGIPTRDTVAGVLADSSQILIRPADSSLYVKYKRTWIKVGGAGFTGSGTTNYIPKFTGTSAIGNSQIIDNGTNVLIATTTDNGVDKLQVRGSISQTTSTTPVENTVAGVAVLITNTFTDFGVFGTKSNHHLGLVTNNTLRASVTPNGQVNIGGNYTSTNNTLQVNGNAAIGYTTAAPANGLLVAGNVGIGTTSPAYKVDVRNDVAATTSLEPIALGLYNNSDGGSAIYFRNSLSGQSKIAFGVESTGAGTDDSYLGFSTGANTTLSERMRITSAGNVGIGTTSPAAKLAVSGRALINTNTDNGVDQLQVNGSIQANGFAQAYTAKTTTYTATTNDYVIDCTSGTFTVNLFTAVGNTGRILIIKNSGTGTITVDPNGAQTIDGAATQSLATQWSRVHIISDGANWKIISN